MPINNYDDPITPLPVREPSDTALEIRQSLIQDGVIPAKGKAPLTPDLITAIIKLADKIKENNKTDQGRLLVEVSDALDVAFKLYSNYAQWMPKEIEVNYEFIDDVIDDRFISVLTDSIEYIRESGGPLAKKFQLPDSYEHLVAATGKIFEEAPPAEILDLLNQAVDCRKDIWPLIKRAEFYHEQGDPDKAIADASKAIAAYPVTHAYPVTYPVTHTLPANPLFKSHCRRSFREIALFTALYALAYHFGLFRARFCAGGEFTCPGLVSEIALQ